jgi:hypothetical protein
LNTKSTKNVGEDNTFFLSNKGRRERKYNEDIYALEGMYVLEGQKIRRRLRISVSTLIQEDYVTVFSFSTIAST